MKKFSTIVKVGSVATLLSVGLFASVAYANHSWGGYQWGRTQSPLALKIGDNVSTAWDANLLGASGDWSLSDVLDTSVVVGKSNPKTCRATNGRVEVCNSKYGNNGWLGIASIWVNGDHITQGTVKLNDTYFNTAQYNTPAWRNLVVCQEVGHTFGLDHQDTDFNNPPLGTCMDYTNDPTPNQHPNQHDYDELDLIYAHLDSVNTASQTLSVSARNFNNENLSELGRVVRKSKDGKNSLYERDFGNSEKVFTFVVWDGVESLGR